MYLCLAFFWLIFGMLLQLAWTTLAPFANFPVTREMVGFFCFMLFSYNFIRWRLSRALQQHNKEMLEPPPRPRCVDEEIDPAFDFSDPPTQKKENKAPPT